MDYESEQLDAYEAAEAQRYVMGAVKKPEQKFELFGVNSDDLKEAGEKVTDQLQEAGRAVKTGLRTGAQGLVDAGTEFLEAGGEEFLKQSGMAYTDGSPVRLDIPAPQLPETETPQTTFGQIGSDLIQFASVFALTPNPTQKFGAVGNAINMMTRGAVADASFDPTKDYSLGMVNGLINMGALPETMQFLAADVNEESTAEEKLVGRLNLALEGGALGLGADAFLSGLKAIKNSPAAMKAVGTSIMAATGATVTADEAQGNPIKTIIKRLSRQESKLIDNAATKEGVLDKQQAATVKSEALRIKNQYPTSDGWLPIGINPGGTAPSFKMDKKGNIKIKWQEPSYQFHLPPNYVGTGKKPKPDEIAAHRDDLTDRMVDDVQEVVDRALSGDQAAKDIIGQANWYRTMRTRLRQEFGGMGDVFADLLGATSAQTLVQANYDNSLIVLRRFVRGEFDNEIAAYQKMVADGEPLDQKTLTKLHKDENSPFKLITKAGGQLFNTNSPAATGALLDMFRQIKVGQAPKTINFTGNLIGYGNDATVDVWAARYLRDIAGLPRIPPPAEKAVAGNHLTGSTMDNPRIGGEFGFGQEVFTEAAKRINQSGIINEVDASAGQLGADDLQAVIWFLEKEKWTKNGWTSKGGEGGSLDFESDFGGSPDRARVAELRSIINRKGSTAEQVAEAQAELETLKGSPQRFVAGVSRERPNMRPTNPEQAELAEELTAPLKGDDKVVGYQANNAYGMFAGESERALNYEIVTQTDFDPTETINALVTAGRKYDQDAVFFSKLVPDGTPNARPGVEVYFRDRQGVDYAQRITEILRAKGIDGFTTITDARQMDRVDVQAAGSEDIAGLVGVRFQYIPEFDDAFDAARAEDVFKEKAEAFQDIMDEIGDIDGITYADVVFYDTKVFKNSDREGAEWINGGTTYEKQLGSVVGKRSSEGQDGDQLFSEAAP
jgi:hypothetical protein